MLAVAVRGESLVWGVDACLPLATGSAPPLGRILLQSLVRWNVGGRSLRPAKSSGEYSMGPVSQ